MIKFKIWWLLGLAGLILLTVGVWCLTNPVSAYAGLSHYSGFVLLAKGLLLVSVSAFPSTFEKEKKWLLAESVMDLSFAVIFLFTPVFTAIACPYILGYWIMSLGLLKIAASIALAGKVRGWIFIGITGVLAVIFSLLIVNLSLARLDDSTVLIGLFGLSLGALTVFDAWRFRNLHNTLNLLF